MTVRFDKEVGKLWTTVEDTGVGIKMNMRQNLFIAFRNAQKSTSSHSLSKSGIGIGLSNSKCLVQALGGTIDLQSKPNKGTIVTFSVDIVLKKQKTVVTADSQIKKIIDDAFKIKQTTEGEQLSPEDLAPEVPAGNTQTPVKLIREETPLKGLVTPTPSKVVDSSQKHASFDPDTNFLSREERQEQRALQRISGINELSGISGLKKKALTTEKAKSDPAHSFQGA